MGALRLVLAIAVVLAHTGPLFGTFVASNRVAVQSFFVLSGFYVALIWNENYGLRDRPYRSFVASRFLRIYPLYLLIAGLTLLSSVAIGSAANWPFRVRAEQFPLAPEAAWLVFGSQFTLIGSDALFFFQRLADGSLGFTSNFHAARPPALYFYTLVPQAWTLSLELVFYLLAPAVVGSPRRVLVLLAGALGLRVALASGGLAGDPWNHRFLPLELGLFLAGSAAYWLGRHPAGAAIVRRCGACRVLALPLLVGALLATSPAAHWFGEAALWAYYALLVIALPVLFDATRNSRLDRLIGELSYPVYLCHFVVIWYVAFALRIVPPNAAAVVLPLTIAVSCLLVPLQIRIDRLRHQWFSPRALPS